MKFFTGLHQPSDAKHFDAAFISVNRLRDRSSDFEVGEWIMDSGAFSTIAQLGYYPKDVDEYAQQIRRWARCGTMLAAVAQDFMCEDPILAKTGLRIADHQRMTSVRYEELLALDCAGIYIMPVLQGRTMGDYIRHLRMYEQEGHLPIGAWVGVGSVCKRNTDPLRIWMILSEIKDARPDLRLHGFGVKTTSLDWQQVRDCLHTADSMAWSFAARKAGRNQNDWREAEAFAERIDNPPPEWKFPKCDVQHPGELDLDHEGSFR